METMFVDKAFLHHMLYKLTVEQIAWDEEIGYLNNSSGNNFSRECLEFDRLGIHTRGWDPPSNPPPPPSNQYN